MVRSPPGGARDDPCPRRRCGLAGAMDTYYGVRVASWKEFAWVPTGDRRDLRDAISWSIKEVQASEGATKEAMLEKEITIWFDEGLMATFKVLRTQQCAQWYAFSLDKAI